MRKLGLAIVMMLLAGSVANAQKITTRVVDNKGTIKWVIDSATAVITKADSTILYVTPTQLAAANAQGMKYSDTASMLSPYINGGQNGLTKSGQNVRLGGALDATTTIATSASNFLQITGLQPGSANDSVMMVNPSTGKLTIVSASALYGALTTSNGLTKVGNDIRLGGNLTAPTAITATGVNTLAIEGLQSGNLSSDSLVVASATGVLKRVQASSLLQSGETLHVASNGQQNYSVTGLPTDATRVWVYRNGIKLIRNVDFTISTNTVSFTNYMASLVEGGDTVEVQWVK